MASGTRWGEIDLGWFFSFSFRGIIQKKGHSGFCGLFCLARLNVTHLHVTTLSWLGVVVGELVAQEGEAIPDEVNDHHGDGKANIVHRDAGSAPVEERINPELVYREDDHCV